MTRLHYYLCRLAAAVLLLTKVSAAEEMTAEELFFRDGQKSLTIQPWSLGGNLLSIYADARNSESFYFLPYTIIDWSSLQKGIAEHCRADQASSNLERIYSIPVNITLYNNYILSDIRAHIASRKKIDINDFDLTMPQNAGLSVFLYDSDDVVYDIYNTLPTKDLLRGAKLAATSAGTPGSHVGRARGNCRQLIALNEERRAAAFIYGPGVQVKSNSVIASTEAAYSSNIISNLRNAESEIERSTVSQSGGGSGYSINFGPVSFGGSRSSSAVTTDIQNSRIINRRWITKNVTSISQDVRIRQVCDSTECDLDLVSSIIEQTILTGAKEQRISIEKEQESYRAILVDGTSIPIGTLKINSDLKAHLDTAFSHSDDQKFEYDGVKYQRKGNQLVDIDSNITWSRKDEDWVPTSLTAYVVSLLEIENHLRTSLDRTVYEQTTTAAFQLPVLAGPIFSVLDPRNAPMVGYMQWKWEADRASRSGESYPAFEVRTMSPTERSVDVVYRNDRDYPRWLRVKTKGDGYCGVVILVNGAIASSQAQYTSTGIAPFDEATYESFIHPTCEAKAEIFPGTTYQVKIPPSPQSKEENVLISPSVWIESWEEAL